MNVSERISDRTGGERGVSEVLGAILVFGLVLAVLALVQVSAVPAANEQVEFEHSQRVGADFQRFDAAVGAAATRGAGGSTTVETGVRYPTRLFLLNPGPVSGDLRTTDAGDLSIEGFTATDAEAAQYLSGNRSFDTRTVGYRADYNEFASNGRIAYEHGVLYERYTDDSADNDLVDGGGVVSGRRITLVTLEGSLSTQQVATLNLDTVPVSAATRPVSVTSDGTATVSLYTTLSEEAWETEVLGNDYDPDGSRSDGYVSDVDCLARPDSESGQPCNGRLQLTFESGTYDLRLARVGLGDIENTDEPARYLTATTSRTPQPLTGQPVELGVEVRDRFNNPVSGETVTFAPATGDGTVSTDGGTPSATGVTDTSDQDGRATVTFAPSAGTGVKTVTATISGGGAEREVVFEVNVRPRGTGATDPDAGSPDRLQDINTRTEEVVVESTRYEDRNVVSVTYRNTNATADRFIREARLPFVMGTEEPDYATLSDAEDLSATTTTTYGRLFVADRMKPLDTPIEVPAGGTTTVYYTFNADLEQSGEGNFDAFFVFTTNISDTNEAEQRFQTFFLSDGLGVDVFDAPSASDLGTGETATTQTFEFTPNYEMAAGETVTIDLDSAQGGGDGAPAPVDYQGASVDTSGGGASTLRGGSASISATNSGATLTYTVGPSGLDPGNNNRVTINVNGVETQSTPTTVNGVTFTWSGASDFGETVSFQVG